MEEKGGAGADADADADVNADAFLQAVSDGEHEEVEAMLRVRPLELVNWRVPVSGYSPLHLAARFGHLRVCQLLVDNGGGVDVVDSKRDRPVDLAVTHRKSLVVHYLLRTSTIPRTLAEVPREVLALILGFCESFHATMSLAITCQRHYEAAMPIIAARRPERPSLCINGKQCFFVDDDDDW